LCQEGGEWKLYDWERLEYGRRVSDEWANYLSNLNSGLEDAYDNQMIELGEIIAEAEGVSPGNAEHDRLISKIRTVERRPVLPADRPLRDLRIVWTYQSVGNYEESLRLLNQINFAETQWAVMAERGNVLLGLERYDEAIVAANQFLQLAPDHPNGHETISLAYYYSDRDEQALPHLLKLLAACPDNTYAIQRLAEIAKPTDLSAVLRICLVSQSSQERLATLLRSRFNDQWQPLALLDQWQITQAEFAELPAAFWQLIEAAEAIDKDDVALAAERLNQARENSPVEFAVLATDQLHIQFARTKQYARLIELVGVEKLINETIVNAYSDDEQEPELLAALLANDQAQTSRWIDLLRGIAWQKSRPADSYEALERMLASLSNNPVSRVLDDMESENDPGQFAESWCENLVVQQMLRDGRAVEAIERFGSDGSTIDLITAYLVRNPATAELPLAIEMLGQMEGKQISIEELRAALQMSSNSFEAANQALLTAIQIAGEIETDTETKNWTQSALIERRADYALRAKAYAVLRPTEHENPCDLIKQLAHQGATVCDRDAIMAADRMLNTIENADLVTLMSVACDDLAVDHRVDDAIANVARIASDVESCHKDQRSFMLYGYGERFLEALIHDGRTDAAEKLIELASRNDRWLDDGEARTFRAAVNLRRQEVEQAMQQLSTLDAEDVASWMDESFVKAMLIANPAIAETLHHKYPPQVSQNMGDNTVIVFDRSTTRPDRQQIQTWVNETFEHAGDVQAVEKADAVAAFVVDVTEVGRMLITISDRKFASYDDNDVRIAKQISDCDHALIFERLIPAFRPLEKIDPMDDNAFRSQRLLWTLATKAMTPTTQAIYSERANAFWACDANSNETLKWLGRLPIEQDANLNVNLIAENKDEGGEQATARALKRAMMEGRTGVTCIVSATGVNERLDAELIGMERADQSATVRLKTTSQFDPLLRNGTIALANPYSIELSPPNER
jgi:hypothetical protein